MMVRLTMSEVLRIIAQAVSEQTGRQVREAYFRANEYEIGSQPEFYEAELEDA